MNVLVIVPTYNERENLPLLAREVLDRQPYEMLVVDDDSPDGTGAVADGLARDYPGRLHVMHRAGARGLGLSYLDGFRWALASGADLICQMDADLSHDPRYLPDLVAAASAFDLVLGSRYLHGISVVNWPLRRIVLSSFANAYVRTITGLTTRDSTSGYRCWRRGALARLDLERFLSHRYAFMVETVFEVARAGMRVGEVPIIFVERRRGASKMSARVLAESMIMPWRLVLRNRGRVRPTPGGAAP
ncbi:MAG TPA: polyprenol monophosphomannose synthase [Vicinamibacterales bacterium]|nr:polyprenol monophosphomannose synthase [Vicinamibacterales bacterium]HPW20194.1 polyprenol monophosphomannose synthase [Vicinamibacterales bacterium]